MERSLRTSSTINFEILARTINQVFGNIDINSFFLLLLKFSIRLMTHNQTIFNQVQQSKKDKFQSMINTLDDIDLIRIINPVPQVRNGNRRLMAILARALSNTLTEPLLSIRLLDPTNYQLTAQDNDLISNITQQFTKTIGLSVKILKYMSAECLSERFGIRISNDTKQNLRELKNIILKYLID